MRMCAKLPFSEGRPSFDQSELARSSQLRTRVILAERRRAPTLRIDRPMSLSPPDVHIFSGVSYDLALSASYGESLTRGCVRVSGVGVFEPCEHCLTEKLDQSEILRLEVATPVEMFVVSKELSTSVWRKDKTGLASQTPPDIALFMRISRFIRSSVVGILSSSITQRGIVKVLTSIFV